MAMWIMFSAAVGKISKSLVNRRNPPSQDKVRSTTQRLDKISNPCLYREENLLLRPKQQRRRVSHQARILSSTPHQVNEQWSMDFMSDALANGQRFRVLTIVDDFSCESFPRPVTGIHRSSHF
jgi:hypothetical protein